MTRHLHSLILLSCFTSSAFAGTRDSGGGQLEKAPIPNEDFSYHCQLELADQGITTRWVSEAYLEVTRSQIAGNGGNIDIPASAWTRHATFDPYESPSKRHYQDTKPPYSLSDHFMSFSFAQEGEQWLVSLRANIIFESRVAGAAAFATASFASPLVSARVSASDPRPAHAEEALDLTITCRR